MPNTLEPLGLSASLNNIPDGADHAVGLAELHIRPALAADSAALAVLWRDTADTLTRLDRRLRVAPDGLDRWRAAFVAGLSRSDQHSVVAMRGRTLIASMTGQINSNAPGFLPDRIGLISELIVDSHGRGGGIGTRLADALVQWFAAEGVTVIEARVPASNPIAQAFWRASGATDMYHYLRLKQPKVTLKPVETETV